MNKKQVLYPMFMAVCVVVIFALWKLSTRDTRDTLEDTTPPQSTPQETGLPDFVDKDGDNEITVMDVTDPNLSISHPRNVEARLRLMIEQQKRLHTSEDLANPELKRFFDIVESEEYLDLINNGATFDEMINFLADQGLPVSRDPMLQLFRKHFPSGVPSEYEPEMRQKLVSLIIENGGYDSEVLIRFMADARASAWFAAHFGSTFSLRDMNLDGAANWLTRVKADAMRSNGTFGPPVPESVSTSEDISLDPSNADASGAAQNSQRDFPSLDVDVNVSEDTEKTPDITVDPEVPSSQLGLEWLREENIETALRERFSPERFTRALNTLTRYGHEEGFRRLKESDPEIAKQLQRIQQNPTGAEQ